MIVVALLLCIKYTYMSYFFAGSRNAVLEPPSIPICELFHNGEFPEGEICPYFFDQDKYVCDIFMSLLHHHRSVFMCPF